MRVTDKYVFFYGGVFSQWHKCEFFLDFDDLIDSEVTRRSLRIGVQHFSSAEQAMMAAKAAVFGDIVSFERIMESTNPKEQKAIGRRVVPFYPKVWSAVSRSIVTQINVQKFEQNPELMRILMSTGDKCIVEASPFDKIWGIGLGENNPLADDPVNWRGSNLLGRCLNDVRAYFRHKERANEANKILG